MPSAKRSSLKGAETYSRALLLVIIVVKIVGGAGNVAARGGDELQLSTGNHEPGWHSMRAVTIVGEGRALATNSLQRQSVSGDSSLIIVVIIVLLVVAFRVVSHLVTRDKAKSGKGGYGIYGGAVCPRCGRPFSRHWWAPNLIAGKLDRCPHCGKWHISTRATPQMLDGAQAFADELDAGDSVEFPHEDEEARLRKRLDESRFDDQ
jgi:hypothetical protein